MAENKFIKHLKGEQTAGSLLEIKNQNTPASFGNMPQGTSDSNVKYSDVRGDVTVVANGTTAWKLNDSALTLAPIVNGDGTDYTGKYEVSGAGLWVNSTYTFPSTGDPNHPVAMIFNPNSKWVLKLCGDNLIVNNGETLELNVIITIGTSNIISKQFTIKEQANQFCKELVIDFDESNANMIKASGLATLQLQVLCGTADASARIYNGMTTLTVLQRKVDAAVVSGTFANVEEVMRDGLLPNDYFSNAAYIAQITDGDTAYAVFQRDGDDVALAGWAQPIPDQTNNAGKFLTTDGSLMSWAQLTISDVDGLSTELGDLQDQIDDLSGRGRFLALWNCATGLAESNPPESPYAYKAGDYFVVGTISSADPAVNYKPDGSSYTTGVASTTVETNEVSVNDTYFYDGTVWKLQSNAQKEVSSSALAGSPYDNTNLSNALNAKQNTLTAGVNISIVNDVISSTAQESFFRGNFNEWSDVPTDTSLYQEDIHGNRVPKDTDFIIVEDASQFIPSGGLMHKLVVENLQATEAFTIRITDENGVSQKYYWANYNRVFVAIDDYYSLKYQPGAPGIWYIKTNDGSPIIIKGTTYQSGEAQLCLTTDPATPFDAGMPPSAGQYTGAWRFAYYGVWSTDGITGWTPQYKIENTLPIADATTLGIAKLYTSTGNNTDGSMTQASITSALNNKVDKNADITGATHTKITYDSKGLVTAGADITLSDVTDITATAAEVNVLDGITASTTELNYVDGVTSSIQTQIDSKQATISDLATIRSGASAGATAVQPGDLSAVATTGDYDDLLNKPTIPAAQVNSDWNANSGVAQILNKPTLAAVATSGAYSDLSGTPSLAAVATSGLYSDLTGTPTIPTTLAALTGDVSITTPTSGEHLVYDGSKWKNTASSASIAWGGITGTLSNQTDLQNALNAKENTITGAATTITANNLAAARALVSNSTGKVAVSNVTSTELGYLHGATSSIQTQLNNKANSADIPTVNNPTITITQGGVTKGSFTLNQATGDTIALDAGGGGVSATYDATTKTITFA